MSADAGSIENRPLEGEERKVAAKIALWYVSTATAIFVVSGMLGVLLRNSQADLGRLDDNTWYAVMTVHGLGAFVGWGAFAVMGFSWWVLASLGFPVRRFGAAMAWSSFGCMVVGVLGIVVTTLILDFAASWVFLYPLPFESAGQWSDTATGLFSASVLLVGLSIVTWCLGILHTVVGPALHAVQASLRNRLGVALGFGYLWPRRFATNPRSVPYPVIPLTVIGLDMIVATLPLAGLLVLFIVQAVNPDVTVSVLGAKNILWFFGHPVVYLLLFPAAAVYYHLVPRYARRPLVAGNVVAVAWVIAVITNVIVWAHHIYLDFPDGALQGALNTAMQPTTFALTIPSALSLYSLAFTIYRSDFQWTAASTALFLGLVGWFLAGISGVVNATIAFDEIVHNTLWIVGHFHHMALLNIGFVIFAATYAYLPELTGKRLWSEGMAKAHIWITFVAGSGFAVVWLVEGLQGAPRRFSVLPEQFDGFAISAIPFGLTLALAQLLYVANVVQTIRGQAGRLDEPRPERPRKERRRRLELASLEAAYVLLSIGLAFAAGAAGYAIGHATRPSGGGAPVEAEPAPPPVVTGAELGKEVFASADCGTCHRLSATGSSGQAGPDLDQTALSAEQIAEIVAGGRGAMPPFRDQLDEQQIEQVAAFVAESATGLE